MSKFTGDGPVTGPDAQRGDEEPARDDEADEAEPAPVDLKATVTLSGEALAALLEEVKHTRKTMPSVDAIATPPPNTIPAITLPVSEPRTDESKADKPESKQEPKIDGRAGRKAEGKATEGKTESKTSDAGSWWPRGLGQPAKR